MTVSCRSVSSQSQNHTCMLNGIVLIIELCSYSAYILTLGVHQKLFHPVQRDDLCIIVQQKHIITGGLRYSEIIDLRIIKISLIGDHSDRRILFQLLIILKNFFRDRIILHNNNFVVIVSAFLHNRGNTPL